MKKGGARFSPQVTPAVLVAYSFFNTPRLIANTVGGYEFLIALSAIWMIVAAWQYLIPTGSKSIMLIRLSLFHLCAALYILYITGFNTPFVGCWLLLVIAAYVYFGRKGVLANIIFFMLLILADFLLSGSANDATGIMYNFAVLIAVLLCGVVVMGISRVQAVDRMELDRSHRQEILQRDRIITIVNNLADAVLSTDKSGVIRVYNAASLDLLDTNKSLNGQHVDTVLPLVDATNNRIMLSKYLEDATTVRTYDSVWYAFEDGERVRLEVTISPIRKTFKHTPSSGDGYVIIMRDITKEKSLEEERDEFISVVSHELRTPITVVEGSLSNLLVMLDAKSAKPETIETAATMAHEQVLYLAKMVNDLSTLSRAERGVADTKEEVQVNDLLRVLYETYAPQAQAKNLTFDLDVEAALGSIHVSRLYLEELLQNFITNAIKYTKTGGVSLIARKKQGEITFAVKDTGIGISKTEQKKVFEKFYRSEDYRTRETSGTGLGLYVVTKLARKLGTEVQLKSRLNHGSTFSFVIPSRENHEKEA
jgi:PAS domain S-box-containing protein